MSDVSPPLVMPAPTDGAYMATRSGLSPFIGCPTTQQTGRPWRRLYGTARWQRMRVAVLSSEPLCVMCKAMDVVALAEVVDHVQPHKGDEGLFFDRENLQPLCKAHHDGTKQRMDRGQDVVTFGPDGWPI